MKEITVAVHRNLKPVKPKQQWSKWILRRSLAIVCGIVVIVGLAACGGASGQSASAMRIVRAPVENGNVEQGRQLLADYGCGACHVIPGVTGANAHVGPPLTEWSQRQYIAGSLPNTLDNLIVWIMNPQGIEPNTVMPVLGVREQEAIHMSAYLYSLGN